MTDPSQNPLTSTSDVPALQAPSYLSNFQGETGDELVQDYVKASLPFLKIVQGSGPVGDEFDKGTVLRMPEKEIIMKPGDKVIVTPLMIVPDFSLRYDFKTPQGKAGKVVKERTYDTNSQIAKMCEPWSKALRQIDDPENPGFKLEYRRSYIHVLYFWERGEEGEVFFLSLGGGEDETFRAFTKLRQMRGKGLPIYCGKYQMSIETHPKSFDNGFKWKGPDFINAPTPFCTDEEFAKMKDLHEKFMKIYKAGQSFGQETQDDDIAAGGESQFG
jgi:hypothetical protein